MLSGLFSPRKKAYPKVTAEGRKSKPPKSSSEKTTRDRRSDKRKSSSRVSVEGPMYPEAPMPPVSGGAWTKFATDSDHSSSRRGHYTSSAHRSPKVARDSSNTRSRVDEEYVRTSSQRDGGVAGSSKSRHKQRDRSDRHAADDNSRHYSSSHRSEDLGASHASSAHGYGRHQEYDGYDAEFHGGYSNEDTSPEASFPRGDAARWREAKEETMTGAKIGRNGVPKYGPTRERLYPQREGWYNIINVSPSWKGNPGAD